MRADFLGDFDGAEAEALGSNAFVPNSDRVGDVFCGAGEVVGSNEGDEEEPNSENVGERFETFEGVFGWGVGAVLFVLGVDEDPNNENVGDFDAELELADTSAVVVDFDLFEEVESKESPKMDSVGERFGVD